LLYAGEGMTDRRSETSHLVASSMALFNLLRNRQISVCKALRHPALFVRQCLRTYRHVEGSIGVVVACRNYGVYLKDTVESCIYQTRPPQLIVIVDDFSEDDSVEVAQNLVDRYSEVYLLRNSSHMGVSATRNRGIAACKTDYVMILDADDLLEPRYFEEVAKILDMDPSVAIAYSSYREFGERERLVTLPPFDRTALLTDCIIMGCSLVRRSVLETVGGYDSQQIFEDWELWIRIAGEGWNAKGIQRHYYLYRVHEKSKDAAANLMRRTGEDMIYERHRRLYEQAGIGRENGQWRGGRFFPARQIR